ALIRTGMFGSVAGGLYAAQEAVVRLTGIPGADRRFTGSYDTGSFNPDAMPSYTWLDDTTPSIDSDNWRLVVVDADGTREWLLRDLREFAVPVQATLDCTSGWYAEQHWAGVPVTALLRGRGAARSLLVHSTTGYWVRFPLRDLDGLLLATSMA